MDLLGLDPLQTKVITFVIYTIYTILSNHNSATISIWKANRERGKVQKKYILDRGLTRETKKNLTLTDPLWKGEESMIFMYIEYWWKEEKRDIWWLKRIELKVEGRWDKNKEDSVTRFWHSWPPPNVWLVSEWLIYEELG